MEEEYTTTTWGKELGKVIYDESKTFCRLCNIRFNAFLQHDSDSAHTARMSIFAFLVDYTLKDDVSLIPARMIENHLRNPCIIPSISALRTSSSNNWQPLQSILKFLKQKKLVLASVFSNGEAFSRTSEFDRLEWIGDHSMRSVGSRVFTQLFKGISTVPFRHMPFLQFAMSNFVLERLYDQLDMNSIISDKVKGVRVDKAQTAMKMKADVIESVYGEITLSLHQQDAELISKRGIFCGISLEGKPLAKLAEHFLIDLTAAYMMRHFVNFVNETALYLETLRKASLVKRAIFHDPRRYVSFDKTVLSDDRSASRLQSLNTLGHIELGNGTHREIEISTDELMTQLNCLFRKKRYFGNEIHSRFASAGVDLVSFPLVDSLNAMYDEGKLPSIRKDIDERFKVHEHLKYLYTQLYTVRMSDTICPYIRRKNELSNQKHVLKTGWLGFPSYVRVGKFGGSIFFSISVLVQAALKVLPSLTRVPDGTLANHSPNVTEVRYSRIPGDLKFSRGITSTLPFLTELPRLNQTIPPMAPTEFKPRSGLLNSVPHLAAISTIGLFKNGKPDFHSDTKLSQKLACRSQDFNYCQYQKGRTFAPSCERETPTEAYKLHLTRKHNSP
ncbi:RNA editing complex protein MP61 [Perkinsela sp. CCAP 1560/4]|nr:RNA editing complex protein MP61 [Perkinsela sp. CCAP 1560/4]|eukprot:KNH07519.1 RNA editing complex protein MP61 [Perkinsela sp. CCAP 1560/4]